MRNSNSVNVNRRHLLTHCIAAAFGLSGWGHASAQPSTANTVLVLGDSLSAEYGLKRGTGWVSLLQNRINSLRLPFQVVNASVSGDTTSGGRSRLPSLLSKHRPSHVIIELGGNDALRGLALPMTQANLSAMIEAAKKAKAKVTLVGMQVPPNYGSKYASDFSDLFVRTAKLHTTALVPFLLAGVADVPDASRWFQADRIHPNEQAQPQMLDNVWPVLQPQLK